MIYFKNLERLYDTNHPLDHIMGYTLRMCKDFMMSTIHLNTSYEKVTDFVDHTSWDPLDHSMGYTLSILKDFMMPTIHLNTSYEKVTDFVDPTSWDIL